MLIYLHKRSKYGFTNHVLDMFAFGDRAVLVSCYNINSDVPDCSYNLALFDMFYIRIS